MLYQNIDIHNAVELVEVDGGVIPHRYAHDLVEKLPSSAQGTAFNMAGIELRFVPEGEVTLTLSTKGGINRAHVLAGNMTVCDKVLTIGPNPTAFTFKPRENLRGLHAARETAALPFAPEVVRILLDYTGVIINKIEGPVRPPKAEEMPSQTGLFYGSSITNGACSTCPTFRWVRGTAEALGADQLNLGLAGNCRIEHEVSDWIAARNDWDFAVLELGINLVDRTPPEEYREKVRYMLETLHAAHPDKYLFCIDIFYYRGDLMNENMAPPFRRILGEEVARMNSERIVHISGLDILTGPAGLCDDLVHPDMLGIAEITHNLTRTLRPYF